jgi:hypothetical protein
MIDPITALAGIQSAVALIKKVSKTVDDVTSLGPVLGKYFDAKSTAVKAAKQAKASGKKSNMAAAIEIELALHQTEQFERELQMLFMTTGKIDVWNKIKNRAATMERDEAEESRKSRATAHRNKQIMAERIETTVAIILLAFMLVLTIWGTLELVQYCNQVGCGK